MTTSTAQNVLRCAGCGQPWFAEQANCSNCGATETTTRLSGPTSTRLGPITLPTVATGGMTITSLRLTWGDVWDVAVKFSVVFFLINAIGALILYLLIQAIT